MVFWVNWNRMMNFLMSIMRNIRIVVSDFLSMVQTLIHSTRAQIRLTEIILRLTRQYIMSIC